MGLLKKLYRYAGGVNGLLLLLYALAVFGVDFYLEPERKLRYLALFAGLLLICPLTVRLLSRMKPLGGKAVASPESAKKGLAWFSGFFLVAFALLLVWYFAYYPMSVINDTYDQYQQILAGRYSDWHPVLHTLLVLALPLKLTGSFAAVIPPQMCFFALALAYMANTLRRYGGLPWALAALLLVLLNPNTGAIATYPTKDVSFAVGALLLVCFGLRVWFTRGAWLRSWGRIACFAAAFAATTVFRHNAVLFTLPFLLAVLLLAGRAGRIRLTAAAVLLFTLIKGVLYPALGVEKPGLRLVETLGLPMTVISTVAKENPDCLDGRSRGFIDSVATPEQWADFSTGSFNSNKWMVNLDAIERAGAGTILHTAWNCFTADPKDAFTSLFTLTKLVYSLDGSNISRIRAHVSEPIPGKYVWYRVDLQNQRLQGVLDAYRERFESTPLKYATLLGTVHLLLLALLLGRTDFRKWADWQRLFLCLPLFIHNFGTMLLLSGDDYRFFYLSFPLFPALAFLLLCGRTPAGVPETPTPANENGGDPLAAKKETT